MRSYAEYSQSGTGIHIIARGELPGGRRRKGDVEMYQNGRFFVMTGNAASKYLEITEPNPKDIKRLYDRYVGDEKIIQFKEENPLMNTVDLPVEEIIKRAESSSQGARFKVFMNGGWEAFIPRNPKRIWRSPTTWLLDR